jgi:hypothetical protein
MWTYEKHLKWDDFIVKDSRGWLVCVVGTEKEAKLIVDAVNEYRAKLNFEKRA